MGGVHAVVRIASAGCAISSSSHDEAVTAWRCVYPEALATRERYVGQNATTATRNSPAKYGALPRNVSGFPRLAGGAASDMSTDAMWIRDVGA